MHVHRPCTSGTLGCAHRHKSRAHGAAASLSVTLAHVIEVVLASASPRRKALLEALGIVPSVRPADVDETPADGEEAGQLVARLSRLKAHAAAASNPHSLVIAADTTVVLDGIIHNKPGDESENRSFIAALAGREHEVLTGHTLRLGGAEESIVVTTRVAFRNLDEGEIDRYVATGEGLDKAGGYAIQGRGSALVAGINGCHSNVVGLSVPAVIEAAARLGVRLV